MSEPELERFLDEERVLTCATLGPTGRPHLMPLWYVRDGPVLLAWTFGKSQKVKNLEREPHATLQIEAGRDRYGELRGAMLECDVTLERDPRRVADVGLRLMTRYAGATLAPAARERVLQQAPKRVVLRFAPTRIVSWDHRKLGAGS
ncbi:MAG: pyridoxamine 5'-phosphate oxidase [Candidatus Rokuibacteriota bacterium]|nr:MAG: pyridoxamine 5'-phosphate oxidase [Candidatus Rokubacteria bacterium]PYN53084.1 MAG: pyridoxamine 5'-phosphate oxidase [Candidatus Rokubacteria bacterium]